MNSSVRISDVGKTDHLEVEMIDGEPGDDENEAQYGQQYTELLSVSFNFYFLAIVKTSFQTTEVQQRLYHVT